jgi:hypothetical protein
VFRLSFFLYVFLGVVGKPHLDGIPGGGTVVAGEIGEKTF